MYSCNTNCIIDYKNKLILNNKTNYKLNSNFNSDKIYIRSIEQDLIFKLDEDEIKNDNKVIIYPNKDKKINNNKIDENKDDSFIKKTNLFLIDNSFPIPPNDDPPDNFPFNNNSNKNSSFLNLLNNYRLSPSSYDRYQLSY